MEVKKDEKEITEEEIKIPEIGNSDIAPEGYTQSEWDMLAPGDKEGILDLIKNPLDVEVEEIEEEIKDEVLEEVIKESEVVIEEKKEEEKVVIEKSEEVEVSDMDLIAFRPSITNRDLETWLSTQSEDVKNKYIVTIPSDMLNKHNEALNEIKKQFEDDEISRDEYEDKKDELKDKLSDFKANERERVRDALKDDVAWDKEQSAFLSARKEYLGDVQSDGTIVKTQKSLVLMGALQAAITQVDKATPGLSGMVLLVKADKIVKEAFGIVKEVKKVEEKKEEKKSNAEILKEKGTSKLPDEINLGDVPEAGKNLTDDGWGAIDRLPDAKREEWLKKQPQSVIDAYVNSLSSGR